jgi:putative membrane protein
LAVPYASSTEELARRYKYLFVLPSSPISFSLFILMHTFLIALMIQFNELSISSSVPAFLLAFFSAFASVTLIRLIDTNSIASVKRIVALFSIGASIWAFILLIGIGYSILTNNTLVRKEAFLLGGFLATSFELVVINGAFIQSTWKSLGIATIHPISFFIVFFSITTEYSNFISSILIGTTIVVIALAFLFQLKKFKTKQKINSLELFQAFLKTWVTKKPEALEYYFKLYSKEENIKTKIIKFIFSNKQVLLIIPGIHSGPFYPVGSYNLSELIYKKLHNEDYIPLILHGVGGHERNLPTNEYTRYYVEDIALFIQSTETTNESIFIKGPIQKRLGFINVTCLAFSNNIIVFISNAPYNSDDLDPKIVIEASRAAMETGFKLFLIDAHNSIGGENPPFIQLNKNQWKEIFQDLSKQKEHNFRVGYAHSSQINFRHESDISEAGIGVLILECNEKKNVLIISDSNNAHRNLRENIEKELKRIGFEFLELCTSDTHNFAARSLVNRGYLALGEATKVVDIINIIKTLTMMAEKNLDICKCSAEEFLRKIPLIGSDSINDFATLTTETINFTKNFFKKALILVFALLIIMFFY